jgi:thiamine pyrophosphokinase
MIDPISISVAFATAQGAVNGIKAAINMGKDINGIIGDFSKFFSASNDVLSAANKIKADNANKTDAQIGQQALQLAMAAKQLRVYAKELKELLIYSGNGDIWDEMLAEQTRLIKEKKEFLRKQEIADKKKKEQIAELIMLSLIGVGSFAIIVPLVGLVFFILTR